MELKRFTTPAQFYESAAPFLLAQEAAHNLILGLCADLQQNPNLYGDQPYMALVTEQGAVIAAALMTPPYNLTISRVEQAAALDLLVDDLASAHPALPGVSGPGDVPHAFAERWQARGGRAFALKTAMRIYQLTQVRAPQGIPGRMRQASRADHSLVLDWVTAFHIEATHDPAPNPQAMRESTDRWLESGTRTLYLWELDNGPVCMAGTTGPTPHGIRVGAVYTPKEQRRHGYASALVAAASQHQLDQGRRFCFLFTDLANPISNHIYQEIGYQPVCDANEYTFNDA